MLKLISLMGTLRPSPTSKLNSVWEQSQALEYNHLFCCTVRSICDMAFACIN